VSSVAVYGIEKLASASQKTAGRLVSSVAGRGMKEAALVLFLNKRCDKDQAQSFLAMLNALDPLYNFVTP
jgi:hypothetical protein